MAVRGRPRCRILATVISKVARSAGCRRESAAGHSSVLRREGRTDVPACTQPDNPKTHERSHIAAEKKMTLATRVIRRRNYISPLTTILGKLAENGYDGPLSVELFLPKFQQGDPYEVAWEVRVKSEAVMRQAGGA